MSDSPARPDPRVGVLIAQLGTPEAPTAKALRPYLRQFLSDRRVIDLHPLKWWPILYLFILTRRPARSARLYQRIWTKDGSPLLVHSRAQPPSVVSRVIALTYQQRKPVVYSYSRGYGVRRVRARRSGPVATER